SKASRADGASLAAGGLAGLEHTHRVLDASSANTPSMLCRPPVPGAIHGSASVLLAPGRARRMADRPRLPKYTVPSAEEVRLSGWMRAARMSISSWASTPVLASVEATRSGSRAVRGRSLFIVRSPFVGFWG